MSKLKEPARFAITYGLSGCYLPDYHGGAFEVTTRRELAEMIRDQIRLLDLPASMFAQAGIRRLWSWIVKHGSSSAHFSLYHDNDRMVLSFHGLTEAEFAQQMEQEF